MPQKQLLTEANIINDIKKSILHPAQLTQKEHRKEMLPLLVFSVLVLVGIVLFQNHYKAVLLIGIIFIVFFLGINSLLKRKRINNVSLNEYEISLVPVSRIEEEIYSTDNKIHIGDTVRNIHTAQVYIIHFDNGKSWNIPKDNYTWSGEYPMSDRTVSRSTHPGDLFWTVTNKSTEEIAVAYPNEYFKYQHSSK